jgi:cytochrome c5
VDNHGHDTIFFANFAKVLGALFGIFFVCIVAARILDTGEVYADPKAGDNLATRIKPVANVVTDPAVLVAMTPAKAARAPYTGEQVVTNVCSACHGAGVLGAPKIGDATAWGARKKAAGGVDGLLASAQKGKNQMPARGGNPDLSDAELKAAIETMLQKSGG